MHTFNFFFGMVLQGARYWCYTLNELGMEDVAAQVRAFLGMQTCAPLCCTVC